MVQGAGAKLQHHHKDQISPRRLQHTLVLVPSSKFMRSFTTATLRPLTKSLQPTSRILAIGSRNMSSSSDLNIENTNIQTSSGVSLSSEQKTIVGSVLDLFAGRPTLAKLKLWDDEATFEDPITVANGRKQYEAQWVQLAFPDRCQRLDL